MGVDLSFRENQSSTLTSSEVQKGTNFKDLKREN